MSEDYIAYQSDLDYAGAQKVIEKEWKFIAEKRIDADGEPIFQEDNIKGIALSGGGIRSASFCLGVMQALAEKDKLKDFDYLSTVSGGGYLGGALSWLWSDLWKTKETKKNNPENSFGTTKESFPFGTGIRNFNKSERDKSRDQASLLRHLRQHGNYLTPGKGISALSFGSIIMRSIVMGFISLLIISGFFFSLLNAVDAFELNFLQYAGEIFIQIYLGLQLIYIVLLWWFKKAANSNNGYRVRRWFEYLIPIPLTLAAIFYLFAAVHLVQIGLEIAGSSALLGALLGVFGSKSKWRKVIAFIPYNLQLILAAGFMIFGLMVLSDYMVNQYLSAIYGENVPYIMAFSSIVVLLLAWILPINYISIHRYYRDRLMETFMPDIESIIKKTGNNHEAAKNNEADFEQKTDQNNKDNSLNFRQKIAKKSSELGNQTLKLSLSIYRKNIGNGESIRANNVAVHELKESYDGKVPYHLINTNIILVESDIAKFRGRGGDNFLLSPLYSGSNATGWRSTNEFCGGNITLPTAVAVSGAAANPNSGVAGTGLTTNAIVSTLMSLFNLRLGYWVSNPDPEILQDQKRIPNYLIPGFWEVIQRKKMNEKAKFVQLSDGGHFENLALYELFRRRARVIIACDAGADVNYEFTDLANAIEKARVDFGIIVDIKREQLDKLTPDQEPEQSSRKYALSEISYLIADIDYNDDKAPGKLIYIKTSLSKNISADVHAYKRTHPDFPDQTTGDQFFDEVQFESYRQLGWQIAEDMLNDEKVKEII